MSGFFVAVQRLVGCFKPRPVQPGGYPTIPWGKIIAKPRSDGGYSLSVYHGIQIGWVMAGEIAPGQDVQAAMKNLARPVEFLTPNADALRFLKPRAVSEIREQRFVRLMPFRFLCRPW